MADTTPLRWRRWGTIGAHGLIWTSKWHITNVGLGRRERSYCGIEVYATMPNPDDGVIEPGSLAPKRPACCKRCMAGVAERYLPHG